MNLSKIGIDAGGSLIKIAYAYTNDGTVLFKKFEATQLGDVVSWINDHFSETIICMTGGKSSLIQSLLNDTKCTTIVEFEATCRGVKYLLKRLGVELDSFVLTNVGTGTSIHLIESGSNIRVGGTGVGGGTIIGLASLFSGVLSFSHIVNLAKQGKRDGIDLKVKDIYEGSEPPIYGELTASNFGHVHNKRLANIKHEDVVASIIGLVGETVATTSILAAGQYGTSDIVYIGSSFIENDPLREVVEAYTRFKGANPLFIDHGEYSGAIGALLVSQGR